MTHFRDILVEYCPTHYGHDRHVMHQRLSAEVVSRIVQKLKEGVPRLTIRQLVLRSFVCSSVYPSTRLHVPVNFREREE